MDQHFRLSAPVVGGIALVALLGGAIALLLPGMSPGLGALGLLAVAAMWFKVALRTKQWLWWQFGAVPLTRAEGFIGISGVVLFGASFLAIINGMGHAT